MPCGTKMLRPRALLFSVECKLKRSTLSGAAIAASVWRFMCNPIQSVTTGTGESAAPEDGIVAARTRQSGAACVSVERGVARVKCASDHREAHRTDAGSQV